MKHLFKKYFIPHEGNEYKPHVLRDVSLLGMLGLSVLIFGAAVSSQVLLKGSSLTALVLPHVLVDEANQDRQTAQDGGLTISPILQQAAQMKADDMATKGYFAHTSPDGHSPWYWFEKVGYNFAYAGENLAVNFTDSTDVNTAWMNSPEHRENILNGHFTQIGIATADGMYEGQSTTFVVQLFGTPMTSADGLVPMPSSAIQNKPKPVNSVQKIITLKQTSTTTLLHGVTASSSVLGASELYVATENTAAIATATSEKSVKYASWIDRVLTSPHALISFSYFIVAIVIIFALICTVFIEIKKQHPRLILGALLVLIILIALLYVYQSMLFAPLLIV